MPSPLSLVTPTPGSAPRARGLGAVDGAGLDPAGPGLRRIEDGAPASLVLEDGKVFHGRAAGATVETTGEAVFTTAMGGYPESITDPSYRGQILVFTYPEVGIYGVDPAALESTGVYARAIVVHKATRTPSLLPGYVPFLQATASAGRGVLEGVDTRAVARYLRVRGTMRGAIVAGHPQAEAAAAFVRDHAPAATDPLAAGGPGEPQGQRPGPRVFLVDFGMKEGIRQSLQSLGARVEVFDPERGAPTLLAAAPDGVLLSNGPGDPGTMDRQVAFVREILGKVPIMGVCLGHQLLGRALGASTRRLHFGHRGVNHPVKDVATGRVLITSQNHGYAVSPEIASIPGVRITHVHAGDGSVEGLAADGLRARSIQFHPEARPGPTDAAILLCEFVKSLEGSGGR